MQDLLVAEFKPLVVACGLKSPDQGLNLGPLHWEHGVLATGLPSQDNYLFIEQTIP